MVPKLVHGKIEYYGGDLPATDCVYHQSYSTNFRTGKQIPKQLTDQLPSRLEVVQKLSDRKISNVAKPT